MPALNIVKNYADDTTLFEAQLDQAFDSVSDFVNNVKLDSDNIQTSGIIADNLAANSVTTTKINTAAITLSKLAAEIVAKLVPTGTIIASAASSVPTGYLYCDGLAVSRTVFSDLFTAIGTAYGYGDNATTFNVPDFRGRFLRGQDNGAGNDPDAAGRTAIQTGGATGDNVGSLQTGQMLAHNHGAGNHSHGVTDPGHAHTYNAASGDQVNNVTGAGVTYATNRTGKITGADLTGISINFSGTIINTEGGSETRPVNVNVRYYIKT